MQPWTKVEFLRIWTLLETFWMIYICCSTKYLTKILVVLRHFNAEMLYNPYFKKSLRILCFHTFSEWKNKLLLYSRAPHGSLDFIKWKLGLCVSFLKDCSTQRLLFFRQASNQTQQCIQSLSRCCRSERQRVTRGARNLNPDPELWVQRG